MFSALRSLYSNKAGMSQIMDWNRKVKTLCSLLVMAATPATVTASFQDFEINNEQKPSGRLGPVSLVPLMLQVWVCLIAFVACQHSSLWLLPCHTPLCAWQNCVRHLCLNWDLKQFVLRVYHLNLSRHLKAVSESRKRSNLGKFTSTTMEWLLVSKTEQTEQTWFTQVTVLASFIQDLSF